MRRARSLLAFACVLCVLALGCSELDEDEQGSPAPNDDTSALPPVEFLRAEIESLDPDRMSTAVSRLASALTHDGLATEQRAEYGLLLARTLVELRVVVASGPVLDPLGRGDVFFRTRCEAIAALPEQHLRGIDRDDRVARRAALDKLLRRSLRLALRSPALAGEAEALLSLLDATAREGALGAASQRLQVPAEAPLSALAASVLALRALAAIELMRESGTSRAGVLVNGLEQVCPEGLRVLEGLTTTEARIDALRRTCGLVCTDTAQLGFAARQPAPLDAELQRACAAPRGIENELALMLLGELGRLRAILETQARGSLTESLHRELVSAFVARVDALVLPGHLPWLDAINADGIELPRQQSPHAPLRPTPVVATLQDGAVFLGAWPRWGLREGRGVALEDGRDRLPGTRIGALGELPGQDARDLAERIRQAPWTSAELPRTVTLVLPREATAGDLLALATQLRALGLGPAQLATWPQHSALTSASGVPLGLERAPAYTSALALGPMQATLYDTLGRGRAIPIFALERHLPDVYAALLRYVTANPALSGLELRLEAGLPLQTVVDVIDAISSLRQGESSESSERLLLAPRLQVDGQLVPLMAPLYLASP